MLAEAEPGRYRTIVADPPWDHSDGTGYSYGADDPRGRSGRGGRKSTAVPYAVMDVSEIAKLAVSALAERDAHLYLWTTNRYLREAYYVAEAWGFSPVKPLVWCKAPMGFMGGAFVTSAEFCLFARRGVLPHRERVERQWWEWPRSQHSGKPEEFQAIVERVSPGPYLELFARRARPGWDCWGDEAPNPIDWNPAPLKGAVLQGD